MNNSSLLDKLKRYDFSFFGIITAIFFLGLLNLYSATHASANLQFASIYKVQLGWFVLSLIIGGLLSFISPKAYFRFSYLFYLFCLVLLGLVLILGIEGMGATRWIRLGSFRFQPSELMKVALVFALARWFARHNSDRELGIRELILPSLLAFVPAVLIAMGPDLGTALVTILIFLSIAFFRKLKWRSIGIIFFIGLIAGAGMYQYGLKEYQKRRIVAFLDPTSDALGSGYNAIQSMIAIGSGQLFGKGFRRSSQASLNYLPENHTDFVFSVFNEEHGFAGSLLLISLYLVLFYRFLWLASSVTRLSDSIMAVGLMSIFFWHTFINMAMVMGLLPIVGLPLPLFSYGGSSILTFGICAGIATSLSNSRNFFNA
jgi:rod shape determining protein RodA